ncbi:MAG TPA: NADH:flavin oxidoreductase [Candidatus Gastranaerophilales bacterium]|nr:NADH:flavin oxidoreductase [Candidatus Gastranaerophilales bacterium]
MKNLFDKKEFKNLKFKNRFIRSAMHEGLADPDGGVSQDIINIYEDLAKGGIATIITGFAYTIEGENPSHRMLAAYDDKFIPGFKKLVDTVHKYDANIILQLASGGSQAKFNCRKRKIYAPSTVEHKFTKIISIEMTESDIKHLVNAFGDAALRAKKAGFDGVQIHAAHGYLLSQFLSPYYNKRNDKYGGSIENRAEIIFETYRNMREKTGDNFPIFIKINCSDFMEDEGLTFDDSRFICQKLDKMGIDFIEISGNVGFNEVQPQIIRPDINKDKTKQCYFSKYAAIISEEVNVPVAVVGGNRNFEMMTELLNSSKIECFSLARTVLCESDIVKKWQDNTAYEPKCISCNQCWSLKQGNICVFNRA